MSGISRVACLKAFNSGNRGSFVWVFFFPLCCYVLFFYGMFGTGMQWLLQWIRCYIFTRQSGEGSINGIKVALKTDLPADSLKISFEVSWFYVFYAWVCVGWWRRNEIILIEQSNVCMLILQISTLISCVGVWINDGCFAFKHESFPKLHVAT